MMNDLKTRRNFEMGQLRPQEVIKNVMWLSISARVYGPSANQHKVTLRLPGRRRRLQDEIFPCLCDGSGKNLLKSDTHTLSCHYIVAQVGALEQT